jgi:glutamine synthetase
MTMLCAEYIWIDAFNKLRSKTQVCPNGVIDDWNYDGSSTGQALGSESEVIIKPRALFNDPFRLGNNKLVLCSTHLQDGSPHPTNFRDSADKNFNIWKDSKPWFGLEQEYFIMDPKTDKPLGYQEEDTQGRFYCSVGARNAFGRQVAEEHLSLCLQAGVRICGINAEVAPGQWEFQIGICEGIEAADHLWVARWILERVAEKHGVWINYHPKPLKGEWNGSGCHINFSTQEMRSVGGIYKIYEAIEKLKDTHMEHMATYGSNNDLRMTGKHETASYDKFSHGTGDRTASIRVGKETTLNGHGYFEDRRPGSNIDPYKATSKIVDTCMNT